MNYLCRTIFGQEEQLPDELTELFTLSPAQGGLDMPNLKVESPQQYAASTSITAPHVESIITQSTMMIKNEPSTDDLKKTSTIVEGRTPKEQNGNNRCLSAF